MFKKITTGAVLVMGLALAAGGCSNQPAQTTGPSTTDLSNQINQIKSTGIMKIGPEMRGVSDSIDNMFFAAKGGNWALADYMGDVIDDYMVPVQLSKASIYPTWSSFYKANLGDNTPLRKAIASKDMTAFGSAYTATLNNCNACHAGQGFAFIKKIQAPAPEANLDYTVKSDASQNH